MKSKIDKKLQRSYVSEITQLLNTMSEKHPKTEAQCKEIEKSANITKKMLKQP